MERETSKEGWATTPASHITHYWTTDGFTGQTLCEGWYATVSHLRFQEHGTKSDHDCSTCWTRYYATHLDHPEEDAQTTGNADFIQEPPDQGQP